MPLEPDHLQVTLIEPTWGTDDLIVVGDEPAGVGLESRDGAGQLDSLAARRCAAICPSSW